MDLLYLSYEKYQLALDFSPHFIPALVNAAMTLNAMLSLTPPDHSSDYQQKAKDELAIFQKYVLLYLQNFDKIDESLFLFFILLLY